MDSLKLLVLAVVLVAHVYCDQDSAAPSENRELWSSEGWQDEPSENSLANRVAEIIKRSKSHQFYGLMGRRSGVQQPVPLGRKRHRGEMFIGLMGRRSSSGELQEEQDRPQLSERRRK
ncbi:protachykinin [Lepisosteus oculatus]|uniref:Tachykinin 1 n=1 Tax=Lepisosteus oculatus TaxID=7918 RepID=W5N6Y2_LEPOC